MKTKILGLLLLTLVVILLVSINGSTWTSPMIIQYLDIGRDTTISQMNYSPIQTTNVRVDFEGMRRNALHDSKALYLSKQIKPPFDPDFKNPCWWYDKNNQSLACLPYFFLAGFPKSGTTDLHARLIQHPLIAKGATKEPHYLTRSQFRPKSLCSPDKYNQYKGHTSCDIIEYAKRFFDPAKDTIRALKTETINWQSFHGKTKSKKLFKYPAITVDASASTAWDNDNGPHIIRDIPLLPSALQSNASIIDWIVRMNPNIRILVILREPVSRVYSDYNYFKPSTSPDAFDKLADKFLESFHNCSQTGASPLECARAPSTITKVRVHIGLYHLYIEEWLQRLPRERIHVVRTEDYHSNMTQSLQEIFSFLELPQLSQKDMNKVVNSHEKNVNRKKVQPILSTTRRKLMEFYKPFNDKLAKLLNNDGFKWKDVYSKYES